MQLNTYVPTDYPNNKSTVATVGSKDTVVAPSQTSNINRINKVNFAIQQQKSDSINIVRGLNDNFMKKNRTVLFLASILLCIISCKEEQKKTNKLISNNFKVSIDFPDTVYINKSYNGKINYKNRLDTVTTSLNDVKKYRFIDYTFLRTKKIDYNEKYLKKIVTDTFTSETNRIIPLYNIWFDKLGVNYLDGIITDEVSIENGAKDKKGNPMTRIITDEYRVTCKVIVVNKK